MTAHIPYTVDTGEELVNDTFGPGASSAALWAPWVKQGSTAVHHRPIAAHCARCSIG
jgi:hypothetical protein